MVVVGWRDGLVLRRGQLPGGYQAHAGILPISQDLLEVGVENHLTLNCHRKLLCNFFRAYIIME